MNTESGSTPQPDKQLSGIELIAEERLRQVKKLGYDDEHDEMESAFQLSCAAAMYIAEAFNKNFKDHTHYDNMGSVARFQLREIDTRKWKEDWPWQDRNGLNKSDIKECLITAGALIAAEIDRLQKTNQ
jgi:hypothetical protein